MLIDKVRAYAEVIQARHPNKHYAQPLAIVEDGDLVVLIYPLLQHVKPNGGLTMGFYNVYVAQEWQNVGDNLTAFCYEYDGRMVVKVKKIISDDIA